MSQSDHKAIYKRRYNWPNQKWVCGNAASGQPCPRGPHPSGACPGNFECVPVKVGDRHVCTRPDDFGGPCNGPNSPEPSFGPISRNGEVQCCRPAQCVPVRSLRAKRAYTVYMLCLFAAALLLVAMGSRFRNAFFSPGPLTAFHEGASYGVQEGILTHGIQTAAGDESCDLCHVSMTDGLHSLVNPVRRDRTSQSTQCLQCHGELGAFSLNAHGAMPRELGLRTATAQKKPPQGKTDLSLKLASLIPGPAGAPEGQLACASCHHEHNGRNFDLKDIDNNACQVCHVRQFDRFDASHPGFASLENGDAYDFPFRRRTRIVFDHASHVQKHFLEGANAQLAPNRCDDCHEMRATPFATSLRPFESMCGACHLGKDITKDKQGDWIPVLGYPSVDLLSLEDKDILIDGFPEVQNRMLSPFMTFFMQGGGDSTGQDAADLKVAAETLAMDFSENGSLPDVEDEAEIKSVERLLLGTHSLLSSLEQVSETAILAQKIAAVLGRSPDTGTLTDMLGGLAQVKPASAVFAEIARTDVVSASGWLSREDGASIPASQWEKMALALPEYAALAAPRAAAQAPAPAEAAPDGAPAAEQADAGTTAPQAALPETWKAALKDFAAWFENRDAVRSWFSGHVRVDGSRWLNRSNGSSIRSGDWSEHLADVPAYAALQKSAKETRDEPALAFVKWIEDQSKFQSWLESALRVSDAGWFPLSSPRSLLYRPVGHADPFLKAWLDTTAALYRSNPGARVLFDYLSGRKDPSASPGNCTKCHSVDVSTDVNQAYHVQVNWAGKPGAKRLVRFNHQPHLKLMDCQECHPEPWKTPDAAAPALPYLDGFRALDKDGVRTKELGVSFTHVDTASPRPFASNFPGISKATCVRCHTQSEAGNNCTICHNYHISTIMPGGGVSSLTEIVRAPAPAQQAPAPQADPAPALPAEETPAPENPA